MLSENLETILLTQDAALFTSFKPRFSESLITLAIARDSKEFKEALRGKPSAAVILDAACATSILGLTLEDSVRKLVSAMGARIILVLAEQGAASSMVVKLLELGAHDVVQKPVNPRILAEQLKALVRVFAREPHRDKGIVSSSMDALVMDYPRRRCYIKTGTGPAADKEEVRLTKTEFQLLYLLIQKKGAVVTYENFAEHLWPTADSPKEISHTLHQLIANIRGKIASCPLKIENLRGEGFRLD